jgi:hypothetical protein
MDTLAHDGLHRVIAHASDTAASRDRSRDDAKSREARVAHVHEARVTEL